MCRSSASAGCNQVEEYDREHGISYWRKNYRTSIEAADVDALSREYVYYDPIYTLPETGRQWWARESDAEAAHAAAMDAAASSRLASAQSLV
jgi:lysine 2,3-aminomutase